jgi:hypothetical protein
VRLLAALSGLALLAACRGDDFVSPSCVQNDPLLCPDAAGACTDDLGCRPGERCRVTLEAEGTATGQCEVARDDIAETALVNAFHVTRLGLTDVTEATGSEHARFRFSNEPGFRRVRCALFGCMPVFAPCDEGGTDLFLFGENEERRCVLGAQDVVPPEQEIEPASFALVTCEDPPSCPPITFVRVACWAYDDTRIVRATNLLHTRARDLVPHLILDEAQCTRDNEGANCLDAAGAVGACSGRSCRPRCRTDGDCAEGECAFPRQGCRELGVCTDGT